MLGLLKRNPTLRLLGRRARRTIFGWPEAEVSLLPWLVHPDRLSIDVGAHVGLYTCELVRLCRHVLALEPNPDSARVLRRLCPEARIIVAAASSRAGRATLHIPDREPGLGTVELENPVATRACRRLAVERVTLDSIVDRPVGFIKIDVEGHEMEVLKGARTILERDRPNILVEAEERHRPGALGSLRGMLRELGYVGCALDGGRLRRLEDLVDRAAGGTEDGTGSGASGDRRRPGPCNFLFLPETGEASFLALLEKAEE